MSYHPLFAQATLAVLSILRSNVTVSTLAAVDYHLGVLTALKLR